MENVEIEIKFGGVQMMSYIEDSKDSKSWGETFNIAYKNKTLGQGPIGINNKGP